METQDTEKSPTRRPGLIVLPFLILVGLLLAPPTRSLLKMQGKLLVDSTPFAARIRDFGMTSGPMPTVQKWERSRPAAIVTHYPADYNVQVAGALLSGANTATLPGRGPYERFGNFQNRFGVRMTTLSLQFPNRPGPYAHFLRFMTSNTIRLSREKEAAKYQPDASPMQDTQSGYKEAWEAFDNAAAQGEKLDPDNAYFPLMRAMALFDAKQDAEGLDAVLRAGQKSRYDDYTHEEAQATWALYQRAYGGESVLLRESGSAVVLYPHIATLRALARLVASKAAQAEEAGQRKEGLALRHAMMQTAVRMRDQGSLISAMAATSMFSFSMHSPGGAADPYPANDMQHAAEVREAYLAYLQRRGQTQEADWVYREDIVNTETREQMEAFGKDTTRDAALRALPNFWSADMLFLANTLGILGMCVAAALLGRPNLRSGEKVLPWVTLLVLVGWLMVVFQMQWAETLTQMRMILANISSTPESGKGMQEFLTRYPGVLHVGEVLLSLAAPLLALIVPGVIGLQRKEPYSTALMRNLQRGALIAATLLAAAYALTLMMTAHLENQAHSMLDAETQNAVAYVRQQVGSRPEPKP
ncbi:MAG: hypothetical protein JWN14_97 [Chthonomonadales bacterium]|nr:hypothetical protein [Chthonomonadales bacterium]